MRSGWAGGVWVAAGLAWAAGAQVSGGNGAEFVVVVDAAHGGADAGTRLTPRLLEKDLTLAMAEKLRSQLRARGMRVVLTRETDVDLAEDTRAGLANHAVEGAKAACVVLHATASGVGVHLYTSALGAVGAAAGGAGAAGAGAAGLGPVVRWEGAQAPFVTASLKLASEMASALGADGLPFTLGRVHLAPIDSLECPAVAVEFAPLRPTGSTRGSAELGEAAYEARLVQALAGALVEWRADGEGSR